MDQIENYRIQHQILSPEPDPILHLISGRLEMWTSFFVLLHHHIKGFICNMSSLRYDFLQIGIVFEDRACN